MDIFGQTRSRVTQHYALITPDTHVPSPLLNWTDSSCVLHISPEMGARFSQYTAKMETGGTSGPPASGVQRFIYVQSGTCTVSMVDAETTTKLSAGGFAFFPAGTAHQIVCDESATLVVIEKPYVSLSGTSPPEMIIGDSADVQGEPFLGDEDARLQTLLPIEPEFDMAVNIFTYQPGATLPFVEIHTMEHGLLMLAGQGVYRLGEDYFPVGAGDIIWMASYCPQWFVAMGKTPATYIYYKDIHRDALDCPKASV